MNDLKAANVTIKNIAKIKLATATGLFNNFSNIYDTIITAIGKAKKINKRFILQPPIYLVTIVYSNFINLVIALFLYNLGAGQEQPLN